MTVREKQFGFKSEKETIVDVLISRRLQKEQNANGKVLHLFCMSGEGFRQNTNERVSLDHALRLMHMSISVDFSPWCQVCTICSMEI